MDSGRVAKISTISLHKTDCGIINLFLSLLFPAAMSSFEDAGVSMNQ
jgi:hypothetical protein